MESAWGVMLYQPGIGSLVYMGYLFFGRPAPLRRNYRQTGDFAVLFLYVGVVTIRPTPLCRRRVLLPAAARLLPACSAASHSGTLEP